VTRPGTFHRLGPLAAAFCAIVVLAAGGSALALLVAPDRTRDYFSWTLRPPAAAALIGGFYLASAVVFGWALLLPWRQVRPLIVGVLGLAVPTLVLTLVHDEVFDFGRWQAIAWVALFFAAPVTAVRILATGGREPAGGPPLRGWTRVLLAALAVGLGGLAVAVWLDGTRPAVVRFSPLPLLRLTGTYLGAWCSFLAVLCGWAAARNTWDDARLPLATVAAAGAGAAVGLLRTVGELRHPAAAVLVSAGVVVLAGAGYRSTRPGR
jgi:hypothetical protein